MGKMPDSPSIFSLVTFFFQVNLFHKKWFSKKKKSLKTKKKILSNITNIITETLQTNVIINIIGGFEQQNR